MAHLRNDAVRPSRVLLGQWSVRRQWEWNDHEQQYPEAHPLRKRLLRDQRRWLRGRCRRRPVRVRDFEQRPSYLLLGLQRTGAVRQRNDDQQYDSSAWLRHALPDRQRVLQPHVRDYLGRRGVLLG